MRPAAHRAHERRATPELQLTMAADAHAAPAASRWVQRWSHLVPAGATVLDVACGSGRHVRWFAERGCRVTGVDRDAAAVQPLAGIA
jgi:2-polyprenyl-3-methyl-5-hydroxy-6-metoxy-1,4-benzoquinol methylase